MLLVEVTRGVLSLVAALGPVFSSQVWSTIWLAMDWPIPRLIAGGNRCIIMGKKPSMFEKRWVGRWGVDLNCLLVRDASSRAISSPRIVTVKAASLSIGGIDITGVFSGRRLEVSRRPATMLPQASRLIGLRTAGLFSLMGESTLNRGCPIETK